MFLLGFYYCYNYLLFSFPIFFSIDPPVCIDSASSGIQSSLPTLSEMILFRLSFGIKNSKNPFPHLGEDEGLRYAQTVLLGPKTGFVCAPPPHPPSLHRALSNRRLFLVVAVVHPLPVPKIESSILPCFSSPSSRYLSPSPYLVRTASAFSLYIPSSIPCFVWKHQPRPSEPLFSRLSPTPISVSKPFLTTL